MCECGQPEWAKHCRVMGNGELEPGDNFRIDHTENPCTKEGEDKEDADIIFYTVKKCRPELCAELGTPHQSIAQWKGVVLESMKSELALAPQAAQPRRISDDIKVGTAVKEFPNTKHHLVYTTMKKAATI